MRTIFGATLLVIGLAMPTAADARCTLGVKDCKKGLWWLCEKCGSQTCMILQGTKCYRPSIPNEDKVTYSPTPKALLAQMSVAEVREKNGY